MCECVDRTTRKSKTNPFNQMICTEQLFTATAVFPLLSPHPCVWSVCVFDQMWGSKEQCVVAFVGAAAALGIALTFPPHRNLIL